MKLSVGMIVTFCAAPKVQFQVVEFDPAAVYVRRFVDPNAHLPKEAWDRGSFERAVYRVVAPRIGKAGA